VARGATGSTALPREPGRSRSEGIIIDRMQRQPMPGFWIAVQIAIVICVLISAVIVIVKL
jgi:hypothetical protein